MDATDVDGESILGYREVARMEPVVVADTTAADLYLCTVPLTDAISTMVSIRVSSGVPERLAEAMPIPYRFQGVGMAAIQQQEAKRLWMAHGGLRAPREILALLFDERPLHSDIYEKLLEGMTAEAITNLRNQELDATRIDPDASIGTVADLPVPTLLQRMRAMFTGEDVRYHGPPIGRALSHVSSHSDQRLEALEQAHADEMAQVRADMAVLQQGMTGLTVLLQKQLAAAASRTTTPTSTAAVNAIEVATPTEPSQPIGSEEEVDVEAGGTPPPTALEAVEVAITEETEEASPGEPAARSVPSTPNTTQAGVTASTPRGARSPPCANHSRLASCCWMDAIPTPWKR
jgi:hypothetical protein